MLPLLQNRLVFAALIFGLNIPFGFWRGRLKKLTVPWFLAIHILVVLIIGLRLLAGIPFRWANVPLFVVAFFLGQSLGVRLHARRGMA
ncbi:MAG: hypothetical protein E4G90_07635 [Gemmatimonadales bacterium]|nr:MAG: hypothetical protein E4G90_07635 [Gemmatimonadales bacterium]